MKQTMTYDQIIMVLMLLGRTQDGRYSKIDAEDDYRADPVGRMQLAEKAAKHFLVDVRQPQMASQQIARPR